LSLPAFLLRKKKEKEKKNQNSKVRASFNTGVSRTPNDLKYGRLFNTPCRLICPSQYEDFVNALFNLEESVFPSQFLDPTVIYIAKYCVHQIQILHSHTEESKNIIYSSPFNTLSRMSQKYGIFLFFFLSQTLSATIKKKIYPSKGWRQLSRTSLLQFVFFLAS
jgi:hypothetical protein